MTQNIHSMKMLTILAILSLTILSCNRKKKMDNVNYAYINIKIDGAKSTDTVTLSFWQNVLSPNLYDKFIKPMIFKNGMNKTGLFAFKIPMGNEPGYFIISKDHGGWHAPIMDRYLIEAGDSVTITMNKRPPNYSYSPGWNYSGLNDLYRNYTMSFTGKGADKYQCRYSVDTTVAKDTTPHYLFPLHDNNYIVNNHYKVGRSIADSILYIYNKSISPFILQVMTIDLYTKLEIRKLLLFSKKYKIFKLKNEAKKKQYLRDIFNEYFHHNWIGKFNKSVLEKSNYFASYLFHKALTTYELSGHEIDSKIYSSLKSRDYKSRELHDKILALFLAKEYDVIDNLQKPFEAALNTIKTSYCVKALKDISEVIKKGVPAFDFSLPDTAGNMVNLHDFRGKVVVMDFWFYGCGSCLKLYKYVLSKAEDYYEGNPNIVFVSVSIDKIKKRWMTGIYSNQYTSTTQKNVVNLYTGGAGGEKAVIQHYNISGYPYVILIDQKGRIFNTTSRVLRRFEGLKGQIDLLLSKK